jgi:DNA-binding response OmpR family regulator
MQNRILLVEDDQAIADAVALNLKIVGYDYARFDDGQAAADSLESDHGFDLALLDIMLPGMDGFELLSYMKKYGIPVIYMTAKADAASEIKGLLDGAEDYVIKPFDMMALMVRMDKVLLRAGRLNRIYRAGDVELDDYKHLVYKAGAPVEVSPLEYAVLLYLMKHKNLTVSRERLLNEVWGFEYMGESRSVDVKISTLRRKLGLGDAIKTVQKLGYRLEDR